MLRRTLFSLMLAGFASAQDHTLGYDNTPTYPGMKWRVHDVNRPRPEAVTPGVCNGDPRKAPSDAEILFDGADASKWTTPHDGVAGPVAWKVGNGYMEVIPGKGGVETKETFGDIQLHIEWASPSVVKDKSQNRGNSGIMLMGRYEVQVLDSFENPTYADGQAAAVYGQYPPLVNASCKPGEWQYYDIVFEAPKFEGEKLVRPAFVTVIHNGIVVQNHEQILGTTPHAQTGVYKAHGDLPLSLQNHNTPVRYRNIWVRRLKPRV
jgi:hypothetical protein